MSNIIIKDLINSKTYSEIVDNLGNKNTLIAVNGLSEGSISHITYALKENQGKQTVLIARDEIRAKKIYQDLLHFNSGGIYFYPKKDLMFYDIEASSHEISNERMKILTKLFEKEEVLIVTSISAILNRIMTKEEFKKIEINYGETYELEKLIKKLMYIGYERVDRVENGGQFSLRGSILDIYPVSNENPYRIEFFGDDVDSMRTFDVITQRSIENIDNLSVYPINEVLINENDRLNTIDMIEKSLKRTLKGDELDENIKEKIEYKFKNIIDKLENNQNIENKDLLLSLIDRKMSSILDYMRSDSIIILEDQARIEENIETSYEEHGLQMKHLIDVGEALRTDVSVYHEKNDFVEEFREKAVVSLNGLNHKVKLFKVTKSLEWNTKELPYYRGKWDLFLKDLRRYNENNYKILLFCEGKNRCENIKKELEEKKIHSNYIEDIKNYKEDHNLSLVPSSVSSGVEYTDEKIVLVGYGDLLGKSRRKRVKKRKDVRKIDSFTDLKVGDYIVHETHGIGKYVGIKQIESQNIKKDYISIKYRGEDALYIPVDQMNLIQKYIGTEQVRLNKLGSSEWVKTKARVQKTIEDIAKDLMKLYAIRETIEGYAFSQDTTWQNEFEDLFPYQETDDQLKAIEEIKSDMEKKRPMDRLLCGDVGFGKTEVAFRAMFKAVMDGKQVMFLVPTTILAQQHYSNMVERFSKFPIGIEVLSRFRTPKEEKEILKGLKSGSIDIIVGTHKLLSKNIEFKDLGLFILDEEQRFGVKQKEKMKEIKKAVDVLALTATPIPRTLHMSLSGIRDMSLIEEPPEERYPVQTYVLEKNDQIIRDAILKEKARNGQVYLLYNRVRTIDTFASKVKKIVPEARITVAHGQMSERHLENVMVDFYEEEYDVLVCTTIIETGLDIPNVNTIIIENSDKMGLSQLYQLRGRVGRSNRMAYAYLLYEKNKSLSEVAEKRLKTVKEFTEFGSGFKIAMRDLEIRGAGNLLGSEQHGDMTLIGYDLYVKYLEKAINRLKGSETSAEYREETLIDIDVEGYIPKDYIEDEEEKIEIYKKISVIDSEEDMIDLRDELIDRFGSIPRKLNNLIEIAYIKSVAEKSNMSSIIQKEDKIIFSFSNTIKLKKENMELLIIEYGNNLEIDISLKYTIKYKLISKNQKKILEDVKKIVIKIGGK